ncbi:elongation of very long chain fatty acids protein-like [Nymphalis io]|uniref:elongation of very long chain fatty acids protein-like n=1 Tax=Inachis io TaxID=171585 RepID=UPI002167FE17|nr:elongation of very long chain fatty acids protein-like [Nymphalis io]XP_050342690.1 elongation of very long chain fatty acids protein-like [Nymphalis io]XP_050342691.1 elongation of very long chain fatty acids protein-like [Nymphalis io]XP_050342692.1 elongation of very long chain fatty acids protein-like [Nymphalis io]
MSVDVGLRFPVWDLSKSQYEETDFLPLMSTPGPVMVILAVYLLYVLKIGPALMIKREPYKLTTVLLLYNALQVAYSIYLVQKYFRHLSQHGLVPTTCLINQETERSEILFSIWLYFAAKVSELLDTVFFVLRKKDSQITFLHLYHHSIMMIGTWAYLKYWPSDTLYFIGFLNSLVHVFMYTYYGLSALGPKVAKYIIWKKYMTKFQLVQFVCIIIHYIAAVQNSQCPPSSGVATFIATNTAFFLILFLHFYRQSYSRRKNISNENDSANKCTKEL